ncbi:MAG TPA: hypothetical protein PK765_03465 [bacterium]|nr:hypothetical protein [bacterium]
MNGLMKLAKIMQGRPSDTTIRIVRLVYTLSLATVAYAGWSFAYDWSVFGYLAGYGEYCWYIVGVITLWWLLWSISPWCLLHRKTLKKIMMGLGGFFMIASIFLIDTPTYTLHNESTTPITGSGGTVSYDSLAGDESDNGRDSTKESPSIPVRFFLFFLGFISLGLGATSKFVTSGCLKYKEKITVIRV